MIEFKFSDPRLERATKRATDNPPYYERLGRGFYLVHSTSRADVWHHTIFARVGKRKMMACTCEGGNRNQLCLHEAYIVPTHMLDAKHLVEAPACQGSYIQLVSTERHEARLYFAGDEPVINVWNYGEPHTGNWFWPGDYLLQNNYIGPQQLHEAILMFKEGMVTAA